MAQKLSVTIRRIRGNIKQCEATPFSATPGSTVVFKFEGMQKATIKFTGKLGTPFASESFELANNVKRVRIRPDAAPGTYDYDVIWKGGGKGNGSGEVMPSR